MLLGNSSGEFQESSYYQSSGISGGVLLADVNGDGIPDLVYSTWFGGSNIETRTLNSDGTVNSPITTPILIPGVASGPLRVADIDGNGTPDVVRSLTGIDEVGVFFGDGSGGFAPGPRTFVGDHITDFVLEDFGGDGIFDLAVAERDNDLVSVYRGLGSGLFAPPTTYSVGDAPESVHTGDFDENGQTDLLVSCSASGDLSLLLGQGANQFAAATAISLSPWQSSRIGQVGDFDSDAHLDVLLSNHTQNQVALMSGNGDGTFSAPLFMMAGPWTAALALEDLVGDASPDLVVKNSLTVDRIIVLEGHGGGRFGPPPAGATGELPRNITIGDFDEDGIPDAAIACEGAGILAGGVSVHSGNTDGSFDPEVTVDTGIEAMDVETADFDGDGHLDLVAALGPHSKVAVYSGVGDGTFLAPTLLAVTWYPQAVEIGDLDGDGVHDLAVISRASSWSNSRLQIAYGTTGGGFGPFVVQAGFPNPISLDLADLNGDGVDDIVAYDQSTQSMLSCLSLGGGNFTPPATATGSFNSIQLALADIDGDGAPDLIGRGYSDDIVVERGLGDGSFSPLLTVQYGGSPTEIQIADVNRDGYPDIVTGHDDVHRLSVAFGDGIGGFHAPRYSTALFSPDMVQVGDLNGDGFDDVITADFSERALFATLSLRGIDEDQFAPNQSCLSAAPMAPGLYTSLASFQRAGGDYFSIDVPPWSALEVSVDHDPQLGDIDIFLYPGQPFASHCGGTSSYLTKSAGLSGLERIRWNNNTSEWSTYVVHVDVFDMPGMPDCNVYDLLIETSSLGLGSPICSGDGSAGSSCPCGNASSDAGAGCLNSTGFGARITATGSISVSDDALVLHITDARGGQAALLLQGEAIISVPFADGILCMGTPTDRLELLTVDGAGFGSSTGSIVNNGSVPGPGAVRHYQYWYRDPVISPCSTGSNFSSGLTIVWE
ncbi:MAG: VCBS repeat-containing protein [Planctomycetes bacterium]|nr:VCBS repeat-containing protein [Planctomycetota bacterium]MCB9904672.1 VCBS repeat-containing protein [Planctomycetota bacterium]